MRITLTYGNPLRWVAFNLGQVFRAVARFMFLHCLGICWYCGANAGMGPIAQGRMWCWDCHDRFNQGREQSVMLNCKASVWGMIPKGLKVTWYGRVYPDKKAQAAAKKEAEAEELVRNKIVDRVKQREEDAFLGIKRDSQ